MFIMATTFVRVALGLVLFTGTLAQNRLSSAIPASEASALAKIVEDTPPSFRTSSSSNWVSPEYKQIYANPLPIPPVKQPKQYVHLVSSHRPFVSSGS
jgi:bilirubin oxidase